MESLLLVKSHMPTDFDPDSAKPTLSSPSFRCSKYLPVINTALNLSRLMSARLDKLSDKFCYSYFIAFRLFRQPLATSA